MKVIKPLYDVFKVDAHWFNTYHTYYINKIFIIEFIYNFCLFYKYGSDKSFRVINL